MVITVSRDGGLFPPDICDLLNIKSMRLNSLIKELHVPDIDYKETIKPFDISFEPFSFTDTQPAYDASGTLIPNAHVISTLHVGKMTTQSYAIGKVYIMSLVFSDITCSTYVKWDDGTTETPFPFFASDKFVKWAELSTSPESKTYFRAIPLNPPLEENSMAMGKDGKWASLGAPHIIKLEHNGVWAKGKLLNGATLGVYNFFIKSV